jgi:hypothetical protein
VNAIANALVALVAALHVYFLVLGMFLWTRPLGLKTFRNSIEKATEQPVLAANLQRFSRRRSGLGAAAGRSRLRLPDQDSFCSA